MKHPAPQKYKRVSFPLTMLVTTVVTLAYIFLWMFVGDGNWFSPLNVFVLIVFIILISALYWMVYSH